MTDERIEQLRVCAREVLGRSDSPFGSTELLKRIEDVANELEAARSPREPAVPVSELDALADMLDGYGTGYARRLVRDLIAKYTPPPKEPS